MCLFDQTFAKLSSTHILFDKLSHSILVSAYLEDCLLAGVLLLLGGLST